MCQAERMEPPKIIECVDCGGRAHLLHEWPVDSPPRPGEILVYRCEDCLDRWDIVVGDDSEAFG